MSDLADAGSVAAEAQPAGTPAQPTTSPENGSAGVGENPFSGLSEGTRKWVETKGLKSHEDIAQSAMNAESRLGSMFSLPAEDAPETEWREKVLSRLPETMRPVTSADQIEFRRPEGLPEDLPYNQELADTARQWAVDVGASPAVAQGYHDRFAQWAADQAMAQQTAIAQSVESTHDELVKDWGPVESEGFKQKLEIANRAMKGLGLVDAYKAKGILLPDGSLTDPQIARAFSAIGERMFAEDTIDPVAPSGGANPFKKDANGNRNLTAISALVKSDPERAKRLARDAGENPDLWVSSNPL